jgi:hypothetical protein
MSSRFMPPGWSWPGGAKPGNSCAIMFTLIQWRNTPNSPAGDGACFRTWEGSWQFFLAFENHPSGHGMLYKVGRLLQLLGLLILPVAIAGNMADERLTLRDSLSLSALGVGVFFLGWLLQRGKGPGS